MQQPKVRFTVTVNLAYSTHTSFIVASAFVELKDGCVTVMSWFKDYLNISTMTQGQFGRHWNRRVERRLGFRQWWTSGMGFHTYQPLSRSSPQRRKSTPESGPRLPELRQRYPVCTAACHLGMFSRSDDDIQYLLSGFSFCLRIGSVKFGRTRV